MEKSKKYTLNINDGIKGLIITVISALLIGVQQLIQEGGKLDSENINVICGYAVVAGISYITKNFLSNSRDQIHKKENG